MWLKCVLHLEVLHPPRYLLLQCLIPLELTPVHHHRRLLLLYLRVNYINLHRKQAMARYSLTLLALWVLGARSHLKGTSLVHIWCVAGSLRQTR